MLPRAQSRAPGGQVLQLGVAARWAWTRLSRRLARLVPVGAGRAEMSLVRSCRQKAKLELQVRGYIPARRRHPPHGQPQQLECRQAPSCCAPCTDACE